MASKYGVNAGGGGFRIEVTGQDDLAKMLGDLGREGGEAAKRVLIRKADKILAAARPLVPDDPLTSGNDLKSSLRRTRGSIMKNGDVIITVIAGGAPLEAALAAKGHKGANVYAIVQHEDLTLKHQHGGPKYLERPVYQIAPEIPTDLQAEIDGLRMGA